MSAEVTQPEDQDVGKVDTSVVNDPNDFLLPEERVDDEPEGTDPNVVDPEAKPEPETQPEPEQQPASEQDTAPAAPEAEAIIDQGLIDLYSREASLLDQKEAITGKMDALVDKYDAGDISDAKYQVELAKLNSDLQVVTSHISTVSAEVQQVSSSRENEFNQAAIAFMSEPENAVFHDEASVHYKVLQEEVNKLAQSGLSYPELLQQARDNAAKIVVIPQKAASPAAQPPAAAKQPRKQPEIPPNMGSVPAITQNESPSNEFAHLEKLSGLEYEDALASMSEDKRARYLNS